MPVWSKASQRRWPGLLQEGRPSWRHPIRCTARAIPCPRPRGARASGRPARKKARSPPRRGPCACPACKAGRAPCWSRRWAASTIPSAAMRSMSPRPRDRIWPGSTKSLQAATKAGCWRPRAGSRCCWCAMTHRRTTPPTRSRPAACAGTQAGRRCRTGIGAAGCRAGRGGCALCRRGRRACSARAAGRLPGRLCRGAHAPRRAAPHHALVQVAADMAQAHAESLRLRACSARLQPRGAFGASAAEGGTGARPET